jgi:hypothetical protein
MRLGHWTYDVQQYSFGWVIRRRMLNGRNGQEQFYSYWVEEDAKMGGWPMWLYEAIQCRSFKTREDAEAQLAVLLLR